MYTLQVDVCDKVDVSSSDPSLDASYYSTFQYTLLDGSGEIVSFDSIPAKDPTGEVQVRQNGNSIILKLDEAIKSGAHCKLW